MSYLTILLLICLGVLIIISGFLSGSETALTATSKPRIFSKFKKGNKRAKYLLKILDNLENVISALLLSNNLVNILASSLATAVLYDLFGVSGIFYATMIMTIVIVIFAEILPKTYSLGKPNRTALQIAPIIFYLSKLLYPIIFLINLIVKKIFLKKKKEDDKFTDEQSEEELQGVIDMYKTSSPDSEHEKDMLQSILTLNDTTVEEVFTHRKNIYSIDSSLEINEIIKKINNSRFTRIPVWKDNPENIIGLLNVRTLNIDLSNKESAKSIFIANVKGGVGKSTVSSNLAITLTQMGHKVGLLDADIYGPNIPGMLGVHERPQADPQSGRIQPLEAHGIKFLSMGLLIETGVPVIWRGPMLAKMINQFLFNTDWGELDIVLLDLPPGTGDVQITLTQSAPLTGALIVTTPSAIALEDVRRGVEMFRQTEVPLLGLVENMSAFSCDQCGHQAQLFGRGGGAQTAELLSIPFLHSIPLDTVLRESADRGEPAVRSQPQAASSQEITALGQRVAAHFA